VFSFVVFFCLLRFFLGNLCFYQALALGVRSILHLKVCMLCHQTSQNAPRFDKSLAGSNKDIILRELSKNYPHIPKTFYKIRSNHIKETHCTNSMIQSILKIKLIQLTPTSNIFQQIPKVSFPSNSKKQSVTSMSANSIVHCEAHVS